MAKNQSGENPEEVIKESVTKQKTVADENAEKAEAEPVRLIYAGPNLGNGRLSQYTVFVGEPPAHLDDLYALHPYLADLVVPVEELSAVQARIALPGTPENQAYALLSGARKE